MGWELCFDLCMLTWTSDNVNVLADTMASLLQLLKMTVMVLYLCISQVGHRTHSRGAWKVSKCKENKQGSVTNTQRHFLCTFNLQDFIYSLLLMVMSSVCEFADTTSVISPVDMERSWLKSSQCVDKKYLAVIFWRLFARQSQSVMKEWHFLEQNSFFGSVPVINPDLYTNIVDFMQPLLFLVIYFFIPWLAVVNHAFLLPFYHVKCVSANEINFKKIIYVWIFDTLLLLWEVSGLGILKPHSRWYSPWLRPWVIAPGCSGWLPASHSFQSLIANWPLIASGGAIALLPALGLLPWDCDCSEHPEAGASPLLMFICLWWVINTLLASPSQRVEHTTASPSWNVCFSDRCFSFGKCRH